MIAISRRYAECNSGPCRVKVKVTYWGQRSIMTTTCLLYTSATLGQILKLLGRNVSHSAPMKVDYGDLRSRSRLRISGHRFKNRVRSVTFGNDRHMETICRMQLRPCRIKVKVTDWGQKSCVQATAFDSRLLDNWIWWKFRGKCSNLRLRAPQYVKSMSRNFKMSITQETLVSHSIHKKEA